MKLIKVKGYSKSILKNGKKVTIKIKSYTKKVNSNLLVKKYRIGNSSVNKHKKDYISKNKEFLERLSRL